MKFLIPFLFAVSSWAQPAKEVDHTLIPHDITRDEVHEGAFKSPKVFFVSPKDGQTVTSDFKITTGLKGMTVKPAGTMEVGTGHHHIIVDGAAIPRGQLVPKDEKNLHFGKGETNLSVKLAPGEHTLTLQFADGSHMSYGPDLSQTIKVIVK